MKLRRLRRGQADEQGKVIPKESLLWGQLEERD